MNEADYRATAHAILDRLIEEYDQPEAENWGRILAYFINAADLNKVSIWAIRDIADGHFDDALEEA